MLLSKVTPRFRTDEDGEIVMPENVIEEDKILRCCCGVPINKYSVFEGFGSKNATKHKQSRLLMIDRKDY